MDRLNSNQTSEAANKRPTEQISQQPALGRTQTALELPFVAGDLYAVFQQLKAMAPRSFFLEIAPQIDQPYSATVIGFSPEATFRVRGGRAEIEVDGQVEQLSQPPLEALAAFVAAQACAPLAGLPFGGAGVFGCIGYDFVREFEPCLRSAGYFSSLARKAEQRQGAEGYTDDTEVELFAVRRLIIIDHTQNKAYLVCPEESPCTPAQIEIVRTALALASHAAAAPSTPTNAAKKATLPELPRERLRGSLGADGYRKGVARIKEHIRAGDIFQAVLAERFECESKADPQTVFARLREINQAPYRFYFNFATSQLFGVSPEALVKMTGQELETHPIAGTRPRGETEEADRRQSRNLLRSEKEKAEHLMLVDLARNDLGRISAPGSVRVENFMQLRRLSNVMHLVSEVKSNAREGLGAIEALGACFPAGTLSGAPKIRAMEILAGLEQVPRGLYGGAVIALGADGRLDSCIAIRSLETRDNRYILRAGAGIVFDSQADREYAEVQHKTKVLRQAIALAELPEFEDPTEQPTKKADELEVAL
jgi:anthranilate synthase component 1